MTAVTWVFAMAWVQSLAQELPPAMGMAKFLLNVKFFQTFFFVFLPFIGLHLRHMEVPRLGVELEL